jgi:cell division protein FtsQ
MSKSESVPHVARTWRDIPQTVAPRAMSSAGRRRLAFSTAKTIAAVLIGGTALWGGFEIWRTLQVEPTRLTAPGKSEPVRHIDLRTDGVLDQAWVTRVLALPAGAGLMELDLFALQQRLVAGGQVHSAVLSRQFPDTLVVALQERTPVVRIRAAVGPAEAQDFVVARDGTVYLGVGYSEGLMASLPWLKVGALTRAGEGFVPLEGLEKVADLLVTAQANAPALYRSWSVVDIDRLEADGELRVTCAPASHPGQRTEVIFGTREDFLTQVAFLDATIEQIALRPHLPAPVRINLAVGGRQVPVAFGDVTPPRGAAPARTSPLFNPPLRSSL